MLGTRPTVSERIIQTVAETTNSDPLELTPLYDAVDPEALDALIDGMSDGEISFTYAGHEVTAKSDGTVYLPTGNTTAENV